MIRLDQSEFAVFTIHSPPGPVDVRVKIFHEDTGFEAVGTEGKTQAENRDLASRELIHRLLEEYRVARKPKFYLFDSVAIESRHGVSGLVTRLEYDDGTNEWSYQIEIEGEIDSHLYLAETLRKM